MMIPGSDLLGLATTVLSTQTMQLSRYTGTGEDERGIDRDTYAPAVPIEGMPQPVDRKTYADQGLDFNSEYWTVFTEAIANDLTRDRKGDRIEWKGRTLEVVGQAEWTDVDGWQELLCIRIYDRSRTI